jgi:hypothetical protein
VGAIQILLFQPANVAAERSRSDRFADAIVGGVAEPRGHHQQSPQRRCIQGARLIYGGQGAEGEQQRIAGQDGRHHHAGFTENDHEQDGVDPIVIVRDQLDEMFIEMQDEIDEPRDQLHHV